MPSVRAVLHRAPKLALNLVAGLSTLSVLGGISIGARAQTLQEQQFEQQGLGGQPRRDDWNVTLGAGLALRPTYPGASAYRVRPIPLVSIAYGDRLFLGPSGLGMAAIRWNGFRAGPVIGFAAGRQQSADPHLSGLGNIPASATAGLFAGYRYGPFDLSITVRQAVIHTGNGLTGVLRIDYRTPIIPQRLDLVVGPDVEFADATYDRTWFGVTPSQSTQSGLPVFTPGAGIKAVGLHASLTYRYSAHILLRGFATIDELTGDIASSPIVQKKTQGVVGLGAAYHF